MTDSLTTAGKLHELNGITKACRQKNGSAYYNTQKGLLIRQASTVLHLLGSLVDQEKHQ